MRAPRNPDELRCMLLSLIEAGALKQSVFGNIRDDHLRAAVEELTSVIKAVASGEQTLTPCQRLSGALFVALVDQLVTIEESQPRLVTISEASPD